MGMESDTGRANKKDDEQKKFHRVTRAAAKKIKQFNISKKKHKTQKSVNQNVLMSRCRTLRAQLQLKVRI